MASRIVALAALAASFYSFYSFLAAAPDFYGPAKSPVLVAGLAVAFAGLAAALVRLRWSVTLLAGCWILLCLMIGGSSAFLAFLLSAAAALALGARLLARVEFLTPIERALVAYLAGMSMLLAGLSLILPFPVHFPAAYAALCFAICLWQRPALAALGLAVAGQCKVWWHSRHHSFTVALLALLALFIWFWSALGTLTPIAAFDDLAYHLRLPYELLVRHRYSFDVGHQVWAATPWAADLAFAVPFLISQGNEGVKAWVAGSYHLCVAVLLLGMLRRRLPLAAAIAFLMAYLSIPLLLAINHTLHTESISAALVMAIFTLWALERGSDHPGAVVAASLMLGLLGAVKSSNLVMCLLLGLLWMPAMWRHSRARPAAGVAILAALAMVAIPYITAWIRTGNPVLPLFNAVFKSPYFQPVNFSNSLYAGMFNEKLFASLFLYSTRHLETGLDAAGGLAIFLLLPSALVLLAWRGDAERRCAMVVALLYSAILLSSQQYLRYLFPAMGLAVLAVSRVWDGAPDLPPRTIPYWRGWWLALLLVAITLGTVSMPWVFWQTPVEMMVRSFVPSGAKSYLLRFAPERELNRVANADMGVHATVLYMNESFGADLHGTPVYVNWYNPRAVTALKQVNDEKSAAQFLRNLGVTHVIPHSPYAVLPPHQRAVTSIVENFARSHARSIATAGDRTLIALEDDIAWPVTLWNLDASAPVSAKQAVMGSETVTPGGSVLLEMRGICNALQAKPGIDVFWLRGGMQIDSFGRAEPCIPHPAHPGGVFEVRHRLEVPLLADRMSFRFAGANNAGARATMARVRTLAPAR